MNKSVRQVVGSLALIAPAVIAMALRDYFADGAAEPIELWPGMASIYLVMAILGFGGHTLIETVYLSLFLSIGAGVILDYEPMSQWRYAVVCGVIGSWYNVVWWKLNRIFQDAEEDEAAE